VARITTTISQRLRSRVFDEIDLIDETDEINKEVKVKAEAEAEGKAR
jgi:hypothetical protein